MASKSLSWVNNTVLMEAIIRYEEGRLSNSLSLWLEKLLDIEKSGDIDLLTK